MSPLPSPTTVVTAGAGLLADAVEAQAVSTRRVDWSPPQGDPAALAAVLGDPRRHHANERALQAMLAAEATLVDVRPASEVLGLQPGQFLHAGPPITWERASGPLRGALVGAVLLEGLAPDAEAAERLLESGDGVAWEPCHHRGGVGPMAGVVSPSMWVMELRDDAHGNTSWCTLNEGLGKVLRYGAYGPEVIDRLRWMGDVLGPLMQQAVRAAGPIDVRAIIGQMVQMGDEGHNRNRAGTLMLLRELLPTMIDSGRPSSEVAEAVRFVSGNDHFFLNLVMPACKLQTRAAAGIDGSTAVTVMARNGTDFGIQTAGTGDAWFTAPANTPEGLFLGSYGPDDANPDIGDSAIVETIGLGGSAMAASPAVARFVGAGGVAEALAATAEAAEIAIGEHPHFRIPALDERGTPVGIDVRRVVETGITPLINTGIAGKVAGTGQIGAGVVRAPLACFRAALEALAP
jgi:hypothetical protein